MNNELLGENEHIIKEVEGAGVIKEIDMEKGSPHIIESHNPNKELIEGKEYEQGENIKALDTIVDTFQDIRKKYSHENLPETTNEVRAQLIESRDEDNKLVEGLINEVTSLYSKFQANHEKERIDYFIEKMKNFLENNKG
jgi:pyruvate/oxaloacetate carboxyltransferase